jgi:hypothetical protein
MKKFFLSVALLATMMFSSCTQLGGNGSTGSMLGSVLGALTQGQQEQGNTNVTGEALQSLLGTLLNSATTLKQSDLVGTWYFSGSDCVFESENLLMQAGGELAAGKIEAQLDTYLAKVGIKQGACSYAFASDGTYTATLGAYQLAGEYTLDVKNKTITMTYLNGLATTTAHVVKSGNSLSLLFEADKLLAMIKKVPLLSKSSAVSSLSKLLDSYDGLLVGMQMQM